mmetsp:Transcript_38583/g.96896  ORF Transcript_38583/g.96896 Transcript_38583/m.96896 type:complete len:81 (+) Transcript_38583:443-685(+)
MAWGSPPWRARALSLLLGSPPRLSSLPRCEVPAVPAQEAHGLSLPPPALALGAQGLSDCGGGGGGGDDKEDEKKDEEKKE